MTGAETNLPTAPPSIPSFLISSVVRNELPARRSRRFQKIRSFFSCMLPRSTIYKNRWNKTCQLDSKCKGLTRNLVIKELGIDGIAMDDTNEEYVDAPSSKTNKKPLSKVICHHSTKSMDFEDSYSSDLDSPRFSCRKSTLKIGMHQIQTFSKETGESCATIPFRISRRIIDCSQDCSICWDSFKVGEQ
eukprot:scaffold6670_cov138-Chaetoceros_neogracile.AAC.1